MSPSSPREKASQPIGKFVTLCPPPSTLYPLYPLAGPDAGPTLAGMTAPTPLHDLSKLRIDRDTPPPGVRRAVVRNAIFAAIVFGLAGAAYLVLRARAAVPVETIVVTASTDPGARGGAPGAAT